LVFVRFIANYLTTGRQVLPETIRRAETKRLKAACLPAWYDVDTPEDLQRLKISLRAGEETAGQHAKRFLIEHEV
jgi:glycosyltransferase A (GT-A) superfamily protein (DUF2064 family)